jgi:hypothetical protein
MATTFTNLLAEVAHKPQTAAARYRGHVRRSAVELVVALAMALACGLLFWGSSFATTMVHDQLSQQKITFPAAGSPGFAAADYPTLQQYAGQVVDNGPKAKAYANDYIGKHLTDVAGGKTYSEMSSQSRAAATAAAAAKTANDPAYTDLQAKATTMSGQVDTLFRGETLRGLLLYAWGWWLVGRIAFYVAVVALIGGAVLLALTVMGFLQARKDHAALEATR